MAMKMLVPNYGWRQAVQIGYEGLTKPEVFSLFFFPRIAKSFLSVGYIKGQENGRGFCVSGAINPQEDGQEVRFVGSVDDTSWRFHEGMHKSPWPSPY